MERQKVNGFMREFMNLPVAEMRIIFLGVAKYKSVIKTDFLEIET